MCEKINEKLNVAVFHPKTTNVTVFDIFKLMTKTLSHEYIRSVPKNCMNEINKANDTQATFMFEGNEKQNFNFINYVIWANYN